VLKHGDGGEEALFSGEQELRLLVETIPAPVWRAGPGGKIEYANQRLLDYLGATLADVIGDGWMERVHPDDVAFKTMTWLSNLESGAPPDAVCRFRGADGQYRWFLVSGAPLKASDGRVLRWYGVLIDIDDRTRAEAALRESEDKLRQIIDTVPGLIWSTGPDGEPTHVSQRLLDYSGMRFEDFKDVGWEAFVHPDDFPETAKAFDQAIQTGISYRGVLRLRRADGEFRWHHARCEPLRDRQGRINQWYGLSVDIDEGKKTEEWPRFVAQLQAILNVLPAYTWYGTPSGSLTFVSRRQADFLGVPKDHPMRFGVDVGAQWDDWISLLHPDDHEEAHEYWSNLLRTGEGGEHDYRVRNAQGDYRWFLTRAEPLRASDGTLLLWIGTTLDIEELKSTEQALRESEGKFRDYAESASDWFWEIGPDYKFTLLTENAFDSDSADRIGTACWESALDLETEPEKWRLMQATLDSRKPFRDFIYSTARRNGSPMSVKASGKPVFGADGKFHGYRGTGTDVTALMDAQAEHERLRELETELAHMNRRSQMGELAASLAHEIAQPIATARNNARAAMHFLDRNPPDLAEVREALACIVDDADRAGDIIDRLRDHIKKAPPRRSRFDLNKAIDEVIGLAQSAITTNGVSVSTRFTEALSPVEGDRVQLQQVVLNLILNAVEAMSTVEAGPRELLISTEQTQAGDVLVSVRDSGPGIDPSHLNNLFNAFYTTKSSGLGMGLSICRSIIDAHGGRLWAEANEPRGAIFHFILPRADKEFTNPPRPVHMAAAPHEDTASGAARQTASEGNKPPHRR